MARVKFIRRRTDEGEGPQSGPSAVTPNRPLAPAQGTSSAQSDDSNIDPRLHGVTLVQGTPAANTQHHQDTPINPVVLRDVLSHSQQSGVQTGTGDDNLAAAVSGLLLLGAIAHQSPEAPSQVDYRVFPNIIQPRTRPGPEEETGPSQKSNSSKRVKRETGQSKKSALSVAELSVQSFKNNGRLATRHATPQFSIFQAILQHAHIFFHFITCLEVDDLVSLYAISKDLHNVVNTATTAVMLAQAMRYAPYAATIFPFRCYRRLCNDDGRVDLDQTRGHSRLIPSFRWLRMVHYREGVAQKIVKLLNDEGLYLPRRCETIVKKLWFLMDIPDNQRRLAVIQNEDLWSASDLFYSIMFFMRIDMRCTDPLAKRAHGNIRRMLLAQPSMTMLCRVLERKFLLNNIQAVQTYVRWKFEARDDDTTQVFGIPRAELGLLQYEGYGKEGSQVKLQRPDEIILKECVRRGMEMEPAFFFILNCTGPRPDVVDDDETMELD